MEWYKWVSAALSLLVLPELHSDDMGMEKQHTKDGGRKHSGGGRSRLGVVPAVPPSGDFTV